MMYMIDTYISPPGSAFKGGAEKQLYLLASSLDATRFKPIVVQLNPCDSRPIPKETAGGASVLSFPMKRFYGLRGMSQIGKLSKLARQERVDIIHTFFEKSEVAGWLVGRLSNAPIWVTSRRDLGFKRQSIYKRIFRLTSGSCDRCVANCLAVRDEVAREERLAPEKIDVIYNGLDFENFEKRSNGKNLQAELGLAQDAPLVGMIANLNFEIKGHSHFIRAAKKITEKIPDAEFVLVGDGALREKYEQMASDLGIRKNIHFLGKRGDVASILAALTVSVLCSTSEGLSNVILESMAAGKPVIATDVGGNPEMVSDGVTGHLVPPADPEAMARAIISLLKNREKAGEMGAAARKVIQEKFTVKAMVEAYERLYGSLMDEIVSSGR